MENDSNPDGPQISTFYTGRNVLITGGTGFMGKVLIERLLATCPGIGRLYLLMRFKNICPEERLMQLKQSQVFDVIREKCPWQLDKLIAIPGDVTKPQLGLQTESLTRIADVSIVFHSAATVKFDEKLQIAVDHNLRPVMQLMDICDRLPFLEAFVYVSTAYSNAELHNIEEKVYLPSVRLYDLLNFVDQKPKPVFNEMISLKYVKPKPNTYAFTKAMAEHVVAQHVATAAAKKYSVAIFRPTIVVASLEHPFPGWIENFNGPTGLIVGFGKGLLHVCQSHLNVQSDQLPVDIAIDTLIAIAWETAIERSNYVRVYNCSTIENPTTNRDFKEAVFKYLQQYPLGKPLWYPYVISVKNWFLYKVLELFLQTLPMYIAEYVLRWTVKKKPFNLIRMSQRITSMSAVLTFFITQEWHFDVGNFRRLRERLSKADKSVYNLDPNSIIWDDYYRDYVRGVKQYLIKRNEKYIDSDKQYLQKLRFLHYGACIIMFSLTIKLIGKFGKTFLKKIWWQLLYVYANFKRLFWSPMWKYKQFLL